MKDRDQKAKALRLAVANRWLPQLEVDVEPGRAVAKGTRLVTDLDVLAEVPDIFCGFRSVVFDCKTKAKESPVNRALWLSGLLKRLNGSHGFCVLKRPAIEIDHRLFAEGIGVTILTEDEFDLYAKTTCPSYCKEGTSHVGKIDEWDSFFTEIAKFPPLAGGLAYLRSEYWMEPTAADACRKTLAVLRRLHPEFDPAKRSHVAMFFDFAALFARALALIASQIFKAHLHPAAQAELSEALLVMLYGGREAYEHRNELYRLVGSKGQGEATADLTLPLWDAFLQLTRQILDAPIEAQRAPLILREVGFAYLADDSEMAFAKTLSNESPHAARFALLIASYLARATRLPPEFGKHSDSLLIGIQPII